MIGDMRKDDGRWYITIGTGEVICPPDCELLVQQFVLMYRKFQHAGVRSHIEKVLRGIGFDHDLNVETGQPPRREFGGLDERFFQNHRSTELEGHEDLI